MSADIPLPRRPIEPVIDSCTAGEPLSRTDLDLLRAVVDTGSLREVARTLNLTQSVVSRRLNRFERRVGARLVHRNDEAIRLTDAGWALFSAGHRLFQALGSSLRRVNRDAGSSAVGLLPMLRLATFGGGWGELADDLATYVPGMLLRVVPAEPTAGVELFERHTVDALYTWSVGDPRFDLGRPVLAETVLEEPVWVALPADHRCAAQESVGLADLADDEWIVGPVDEARELLATTGAQRGVELRVTHVVESGAEMRSLLANGRGVALVSPLTSSCRFAVKELRSAPVRRHVLLSDPTVVSRNLHDALRTRLSNSYLARARERNPSYLGSDRFPRLGQDQPPCQHTDPRILAGLSVAPRSPHHGGAEPMLEPEDLHLLRVVADCGSLNRAAPVLLITQPALTRRISRLERRLGLQLLLRGHRGTALTSAARRLMEGAAEAEAFFQSVSAAVRDQAQDTGGRARLRPVPVGSPRPRATAYDLPVSG